MQRHNHYFFDHSTPYQVQGLVKFGIFCTGAVCSSLISKTQCIFGFDFPSIAKFSALGNIKSHMIGNFLFPNKVISRLLEVLASTAHTIWVLGCWKCWKCCLALVGTGRTVHGLLMTFKPYSSVSEAEHCQGCRVLFLGACLIPDTGLGPQLSSLMVVSKWMCVLVKCVSRVETLLAGSFVRLRKFYILIGLFSFIYIYLSPCFPITLYDCGRRKSMRGGLKSHKNLVLILQNQFPPLSVHLQF